MTGLELTVVLGLASAVAGFLGSLTGLGGGVVIVPLLTLGFGIDLRYAVGASLVSVIATSSAAGAAYARDGYCNLRLGMLLEVGTTLGAVAGAALATVLPVSITAVVFGVVLLVSAYLSLRKMGEEATSFSWSASLVPTCPVPDAATCQCPRARPLQSPAFAIDAPRPGEYPGPVPVSG